MRTTVPQRRLCCWHRTLSRPSMETTTKMSTSLDTLPMTGCCLRGTRAQNISQPIWLCCKWLAMMEVSLEFSHTDQVSWNLDCVSFPVGIFNDFLSRKQSCAVQHPFRWSHCVCVHRVLEQHKLTKEQWEDRIQTWHEEHRGMLRCVSNFPYYILHLKLPGRDKEKLYVFGLVMSSGTICNSVCSCLL